MFPNISLLMLLHAGVSLDFESTTLEKLNQSLEEEWEAAGSGRVSSAQHWSKVPLPTMEKINVLVVSPREQHCIFRNTMQCVLTYGKQMP